MPRVRCGRRRRRVPGRPGSELPAHPRHDELRGGRRVDRHDRHPVQHPETAGGVWERHGCGLRARSDGRGGGARGQGPRRPRDRDRKERRPAGSRDRTRCRRRRQCRVQRRGRAVASGDARRRGRRGDRMLGQSRRSERGSGCDTGTGLGRVRRRVALDNDQPERSVPAQDVDRDRWLVLRDLGIPGDRALHRRPRSTRGTHDLASL